MALIYREWRTVFAVVIAISAITGSYLLSRGAGAPPVAEASTETALLQEIATKDSNGDGLPDWEKSLYGIPLDATSTDYFHLGMTDGEAVAKGLIVPIATGPAAASSTPSSGSTTVIDGTPAPTQGSLTDTFAQNFFTLYIAAEQANNGSLTNDQINAVAAQAMQELTSSATPTPDFKTTADITVAGSGATALVAYANNAAQVIAAHAAVLPESELQYLQDYMDDSDPTALQHIKQIAGSYHDTAVGLAALSVPAELQQTHLALVNALYRISQDANDFSNVDSDPLTTMLALEQYPQTVVELANTFGALNTTYTNEHVVLPPGSRAAIFVNVAPETAAKEAAAASTP